MKKLLATGLIAVSMMGLSSMASAAEADTQEPMLLSAQQMDDVTAGSQSAMRGIWSQPGLARMFMAISKQATVNQITISPITIIQIGNNNTAIVFTGNLASIIQ